MKVCSAATLVACVSVATLDVTTKPCSAATPVACVNVADDVTTDNAPPLHPFVSYHHWICRDMACVVFIPQLPIRSTHSTPETQCIATILNHL